MHVLQHVLQQQFDLGKIQYELYLGESQAFLPVPSDSVNVNYKICSLIFSV